MHLIEKKKVEEKLTISANDEGSHMNHRDDQHMARPVEEVETEPFQVRM